MRQVGSLFKPFVYTAAITLGATARTELQDVPSTFDAGPGQPPYEPRNYDREFKGPLSLRQALDHSRNVPVIRLMQELGPATVIPYARQLGITSPIPPYLSVAIGAAEGSLLEMTSAYSAFPNGGVRMAPLMILDVTDRDGTTLELLHFPQPGTRLARGPRPMNQVGLTHLSFLVEDLDAALARLAALGAQVLGETRLGADGVGPKAIFVTDPDGTRIELVEGDFDPAAWGGG